MDEVERAEKGADRREASPGAFFLLLVWSAFMTASGISVVLYVLGQPLPTELLFLDAVLMIGLWLGTLPRERPAALVPPCEACRGRRFPTRHPEGVRLWTCFRCGRETPRRRSYQQLVTGTLGEPA